MSLFSLPPDISCRKQQLSACQAYVFRHRTLGELGRIVLRGLPNGHCHISSEVAGDPDDPMTERRKEIFVPLSKQVTDILETVLGRGEAGSHVVPASPKSPQEAVECKYLSCERCGAAAALLIFAYDAMDPGRFEDYARKMYHEYKRLDVPTWIIGPPMGMAGFETPSEILKVWPEREPIRRLTPNSFNAELDALLEKHC
jgi:hypothetical protein